VMNRQMQDDRVQNVTQLVIMNLWCIHKHT
jgi:hypothetical protein